MCISVKVIKATIIFKGVVINIVNLFVIILKKEKEKKMIYLNLNLVYTFQYKLTVIFGKISHASNA